VSDTKHTAGAALISSSRGKGMRVLFFQKEPELSHQKRKCTCGKLLKGTAVATTPEISQFEPIGGW